MTSLLFLCSEVVGGGTEQHSCCWEDVMAAPLTKCCVMKLPRKPITMSWPHTNILSGLLHHFLQCSLQRWYCMSQNLESHRDVFICCLSELEMKCFFIYVIQQNSYSDHNHWRYRHFKHLLWKQSCCCVTPHTRNVNSSVVLWLS